VERPVPDNRHPRHAARIFGVMLPGSSAAMIFPGSPVAAAKTVGASPAKALSTAPAFSASSDGAAGILLTALAPEKMPGRFAAEVAPIWRKPARATRQTADKGPTAWSFTAREAHGGSHRAFPSAIRASSS